MLQRVEECYRSIAPECLEAFKSLLKKGNAVRMKVPWFPGYEADGKSFKNPEDIQEILAIRDTCINAKIDNEDGSRGDLEWTLYHGVFQLVLYNRYVEVPNVDDCFLRVRMEKDSAENFKVQLDLGGRPMSGEQLKKDGMYGATDASSTTGATVFETVANNRATGVPTCAVIGAAAVPATDSPDYVTLTQKVYQVLDAMVRHSSIEHFMTMSGGHAAGIPLLAQSVGTMPDQTVCTGVVSVTPRAGNFLIQKDLLSISAKSELMGFWGRTWGDDSPGLSWLSDAAIIAGIPFGPWTEFEIMNFIKLNRPVGGILYGIKDIAPAWAARNLRNMANDGPCIYQMAYKNTPPATPLECWFILQGEAKVYLSTDPVKVASWILPRLDPDFLRERSLSQTNILNPQKAFLKSEAWIPSRRAPTASPLGQKLSPIKTNVHLPIESEIRVDNPSQMMSHNHFPLFAGLLFALFAFFIMRRKYALDEQLQPLITELP